MRLGQTQTGLSLYPTIVTPPPPPPPVPAGPFVPVDLSAPITRPRGPIIDFQRDLALLTSTPTTGFFFFTGHGVHLSTQHDADVLNPDGTLSTSSNLYLSIQRIKGTKVRYIEVCVGLIRYDGGTSGADYTIGHTLFDSIFAAARAAGIYVAVNFIDRTFGSAVTTLPGGVYPKWWTWGTSGTEMVQLPPGGTGNPGSLQSVAAYWNSNTYNAMMAAYTDFCNRYQNEPSLIYFNPVGESAVASVTPGFSYAKQATALQSMFPALRTLLPRRMIRWQANFAQDANQLDSLTALCKSLGGFYIGGPDPEQAVVTPTNINLTAAPTAGSTSGTLTAAWNNATRNYLCNIGPNKNVMVQFTRDTTTPANSLKVTWPPLAQDAGTTSIQIIPPYVVGAGKAITQNALMMGNYASSGLPARQGQVAWLTEQQGHYPWGPTFTNIFGSATSWMNQNVNLWFLVVQDCGNFGPPCGGFNPSGGIYTALDNTIAFANANPIQNVSPPNDGFTYIPI